jgi:RecQ family ATP-dependent DNA helicase
MITIEQAQRALHEYFDFADFREGQKEVITSILEGNDTVVVMPTGGGKSLCYQLPAMLLEGTTIVVSPLIALMKDQVDALRARNLPATFINSSIDLEEQKARINGIRRGAYKLIYIAPERFRSAHFLETLRNSNISLFAIDEAHCISQWGHDFRPDYLRLKQAIEEIGRPQVLALTATATPYVRADIIEQLGLRNPKAFVSGFDRPNLSIEVVHTLKEREKITCIKALAMRAKESGIIYASTRKSVEQLVGKLQSAGLKVVAYHAGMDDRTRSHAQEEFMSGQKQLIVATNAFGMGIDKPNIRFVVHFQLPGSIEAYYQEIGRAGRDGLPALCTLLFNYADKRTQDFFIEGSYPPPELIKHVYDTLVATRHKTIELSTREIAQRAGERNELAVQSALVLLEKAGHIERTLSNENRVRVVQLLDNVPAKHLRINPQEIARRAAFEQRKLREMINFCYTDKCRRIFILDYFGDKHHAKECGTCSNCIAKKEIGKLKDKDAIPLTPTTTVDKFIKEYVPVALDLERELNEQSKRHKIREEAERAVNKENESDSIKVRPIDEDEKLTVRKILSCAARMQGRFGKIVLAATLRGSRSEKVLEPGLDKLSTYGLLSDYTQEEILIYIEALISAKCLVVSTGAYPTVSITNLGKEVMLDRTNISLALPGSRREHITSTVEKQFRAQQPLTMDETYRLYKQGLSIEEIAKERNLAEMTIEKHLADCILIGRPVKLEQFVSLVDQRLIEEAIATYGAERLRPLKDTLPDHITYRMIRFVVADFQQRQSAMLEKANH